MSKAAFFFLTWQKKSRQKATKIKNLAVKSD